jgi:hypothetical protein
VEVEALQLLALQILLEVLETPRLPHQAKEIMVVQAYIAHLIMEAAAEAGRLKRVLLEHLQ